MLLIMKSWFALFILGSVRASTNKVINNKHNNNVSVHLVVAQFNEDVSWVRNVTRIRYRSKFVYQKTDPKKKHYLPNVGNECLAYVTHIVDNYNHSLADYSIFVHGDPSKHCNNFLDYLNSVPLFTSKKDYEEDTNPKELVFITHTYYTHSPAILKRYIPDLYVYSKKWIDYEIPERGTAIWCNAQFIVSKRLILQRPFTFWKELQKDLLSDDGKFKPTGAYLCGYLEQLWSIIFLDQPVVDKISQVYLPTNGQHLMCYHDASNPEHMKSA